MVPRSGSLALMLFMFAGCRAAPTRPASPGVESSNPIGEARTVASTEVRESSTLPRRNTGECPNPECSRAGDSVVLPTESVSREERLRAAIVAIRGPGSLTLDAEVGHPVRGRLESDGESTVVEVCVKEVATAKPRVPAFVRLTFRLCSEEGTTYGTELRLFERPSGKFDVVPEGWSSDVVEGMPFHRYIACPGGTAWDIDALADVLDGGVVRFTVLGKYRSCTK